MHSKLTQHTQSAPAPVAAWVPRPCLTRRRCVVLVPRPCLTRRRCVVLVRVPVCMVASRQGRWQQGVGRWQHRSPILAHCLVPSRAAAPAVKRVCASCCAACVRIDAQALLLRCTHKHSCARGGCTFTTLHHTPQKYGKDFEELDATQRQSVGGTIGGQHRCVDTGCWPATTVPAMAGALLGGVWSPCMHACACVWRHACHT
jgi:hypothetical protein